MHDANGDVPAVTREVERARALTELVESMAPIGRVEWPVAQDRLVCSAAFSQLHGCRQAPDTLAAWIALVHPDDREALSDAFSAIRAGAPDCALHYRIVDADDGTVRQALLNGRLLFSGTGEPAWFVGVVKALTERRVSDATLLAERERLANIIKGTDVGTWEWNVQTGETVFNTRWAEMVGYSLASLAPASIETWKSLTHPGDLAAAAVALERHFAGETPEYDAELRMRHRDGHWVWVRDRGRVLRWTDDGQPLLMFGTHLDITREKQAEQALEREHARYLGLLRNASDGVHIVDENLRLVECSESFCAMLGYRRDEMLGMHILDWDAVHTEDMAREKVALQLAQPVRTQFETTHRRKDGSLIDVEVSGFPVVIDGAPLIFNSSRDISARKAAERALRDSEARFRALFDHMQSGFAVHEIITDGAGRPVDYVFLAANDAFGRLTGLRPGGIVGRRITEVYPEIAKDETDWIACYGEVALTGKARHFESFAAGLGRTYDIIAYAPQPGQFAVVINDVSEQRQVADALRESSRFNAQVIASAQEGIIVYGPDLRYQVWNDYMMRFTGMRAEDVLGRYPTEVFPFLEPTGVIETLRGALKGDIPAPVEFSFEIHQTGRRGWASDRMAPLRNAQGDIVGVIATVRDITEVKEAEYALRELNEGLEARVAERTRELAEATRAAEAASRAKGDFLANMSHEIRTPMTTILGSADLLRFDGVTPQQARRLDQIDAAARHLLGLIDDVLDLAKIEAGRLQLAHDPVDVGELLSHVVSMLGDRARDKGLSFRVDNRVPPQPLVGDVTRLRQALINYASNAVKFTERGSITLSALIDRDSGDRVVLRFAVTDTGMGVAAPALARLFAPFEQVDSSLTRSHGGTGLGLAIVRRLAHLMGGEAGAESRENLGSTFWFTAQLRRAWTTSVRPPAEPLRTDLASAPWRVLVVDDDATNRGLIIAMLETAQVQVDSAVDGVDAVAQATHQRYDLILMDLQMPRLDGYAAAMAIRGQETNQETPIIALTGNALLDVRQQCFDAGMNDYIAKPFTMRSLLDRVERWATTRAGE